MSNAEILAMIGTDCTQVIYQIVTTPIVRGAVMTTPPH